MGTTSQAIEEAMLYLDAEVIRPSGWDALPTLALIYSAQLGQPRRQVYVVDSYRELLRVAPPQATPFQVLSRYAEGLNAMGNRWPQSVDAIMLACEAWMVDYPPDNLAERDQIDAANRDRSLSAHPNRVEVRSLISVDREGVTRSLQYDRASENTAGLTVDTPDGGHGFSGGVPEGLTAILAAL